MNFIKAFLASLLITLLACASANAQDGSTGAAAVALKGYDTVAYFSDNRASKGSPEFRQDFDGVRYYFSSARNRAAFNADPDRFTPQFGGYCAMGISRGKKFDADPTVFRIVDGKLYVFSSPKAGDAADQDSELLARARQAWESLK